MATTRVASIGLPPGYTPVVTNPPPSGGGGPLYVPVLNFTQQVLSNNTVLFRWTVDERLVPSIVTDSGIITIKQSNGGRIYNTPKNISLRSRGFVFPIPIISGKWFYGEISYKTPNGPSVLRTSDFGINPIRVNVSNIQLTSAVLTLSGETLPSVSDSFRVYKVSDNSLVFTSPIGPVNNGRSVTVTNLQSGTEYNAVFKSIKSPNFRMMLPMPVCTGTPTTSSNAGTVTKKTGQTIPGVSGTFDVYDATTFCPALYGGVMDMYTYRLPNNGDYDLYARNYYTNLIEPSFFDVMQGAIGNCVLEAVMAVAAHKNPSLVKSGIVPDPTTLHTFFIRFYYKKINAPFWVRLTATLPMVDMIHSYDDMINSVGRLVIWSNLIMKAYCCMTNIFPDFMLHSGVGYNCLYGIDFVECPSAIFGQDTNTDIVYSGIDYECFSDASVNRYKSELDAQNIKNMINSRDVIITAFVDFDIGLKMCASYALTSRYAKDTVKNKNVLKVFNTDQSIKHCFIFGHAYSVLEYRNSDNKVLIRNPWGGYNPCTPYNYGIYAVDYDDFIRCFVFVLIKRTANPVMSNLQLLTRNDFP